MIEFKLTQVSCHHLTVPQSPCNKSDSPLNQIFNPCWEVPRRCHPAPTSVDSNTPLSTPNTAATQMSEEDKIWPNMEDMLDNVDAI